MTTIATDGKTMAGDGREVEQGTIIGSFCRKVQRLADGRLVGVAGDSIDEQMFRRWLEDGAESKPRLKELVALVLYPSGRLDFYDHRLVASPIEAPAAIGSGADHALTAMDCGKSPEEAVEYAARRDPNTGGKTTVLSL